MRDKKFSLSGMLSITLLLCFAILVSSCGETGNQGSSFSIKGLSPSDSGESIPDRYPQNRDLLGTPPNITKALILQTMEKARYVDGEILVKFRKRQGYTESLHRAMGSSVIRRFKMFPDLEHVRLPEGVSVREGIMRYMADPIVEYAEPNYIRKVSRIPNDTYFNQQWSLLNIGQFNGTPKSDIKATGAWDINTGSNDVVIVVIDTGIDYNHPDLISNRWLNDKEIPDNGIDDDGNGKIDDRFGWDFTTCAKFNPTTGRCTTPKGQDNDPMDDNDHGTHVSGIIGASGNNATDISGIMWNVRLMPLKILNADGEGSVADEISAIDYAAMMKGKGINIMAINASFGGGGYSASEFDAISRVNNAGIIFVTAAGNGGDDGIGDNNDVTPSYPGNYNLPNIISVAATDQNDNLATFSNYGFNNVHVAAPGVHILSIVPRGLDYYSGTSMATPHVTGLVGLLYSQYPEFSPSQIRSTILRYVDKIPSLSGKVRSEGRINAYKALSSLLPPSDLKVNTVSSGVSLQWTDRATGEDGYRLERRVGSGSYSTIATLPANSGSYNDSSLTDGLSYYYRIRAYNDIAESNLANEVVAITPLKGPSNLSLTAGITEVTLSWIDNSASEEGFKIERKGPEGVFTLIITTSPNITTFTDTNLQPSTAYTYRVKAFNYIAGESIPVEAAITTGSQSTRTGSSGGGGGGCSILASRDSGHSGIFGESRSGGYDISLVAIFAIYFINILRKRNYH